jgi:TRAP-type C4-dicarboxylate transport system permease small subunit
VSRLLFIWLAYMGAAIGLREGTLIVIDTIPELVGPPARRVLDPFVRIVSFAIILFLFAASLPLVQSVWPTTLATVDWISNAWTYLAFTASFGLMILYSVAPLVPGLVAPRVREVRP